MSGLVCVTSCILNKEESFKKTVEDSLIGRQQLFEYHDNKFCDVGLVSTPKSCASKYSDLGITVFVDGYFSETLGSSISSAEWFYNKYSESSESCFGKLNGSFNVIIVDEVKETITLLNDRYGTRPLFYSPSIDGFAISYKAEILANLCSLSKDPDPYLIANMLSIGRVLYGDNTFYTGVKSLEGGVVVQWNTKGEVVKKKYPVEYMYAGVSPSVDELVQIFKDVIRDFNKVPNLGLSLSGGLDSRILLASDFDGPTFTWGYNEKNDEIELSRECAEVASSNWNFVKLKPADFLDLDGKGDNLREGLDLFVQSYALHCYPKVVESGVDGLMTGLALDFTMAGSYYPTNSNLNLSETIAFIFSKIETFDENFSYKHVLSSEIGEYITRLRERLIEEVSENFYKYGSVQAIQKFFEEYRVRRCIFQRQMWQRAFCEDYIPTYDNRIIDYLLLFSEEDKANHKLFRTVLLSLSKELSSIAYQGTKLPPDVPIEYWSEGEKIEQAKEALTRKIFFQSDGKVYVPYNRYYSNFDEWLRVDKGWKDEFKRLLMHESSIIQQHVDIRYLENLLSEQESGEKVNYSKLLVLASLEKHLRKINGNL